MSATITTIVFTDIVSSTLLMQRMGDEQAHSIFEAHHALVRDAIRERGGEELQWLGDGLVAGFASAAEAVACAISVQEETERKGGEHGLRIRIGINVGEMLHDDEGCGYFGTPVVTAKRLCDVARPGEILCSGTVAGLLAGRSRFRFRDLGLMSLKGVAEPLPVREVIYDSPPAAAVREQHLGATGIPLPALLLQPAPFPFSGRRRELDHLTSLWREAAGASRQVVLIEGEPGVGKTRLAAEAARLVHKVGGTVLFGRCDEGMGVPYQPFVEALEQFLEYAPDRDLREQLGHHAGEFARLCPESIQRVPGLPRPLQSDPATERYRLFDAVAAWLRAATAARPILLVLDDLHWANTPTLLLLRHLVRATVNAALLFVGTYRDTEVDRAHFLTKLLADLRVVSGVEILPLRGLDEDGAIEFVEQAMGSRLDEEGRGFARVVRAETAGNPFFLGEVLRHLEESGALVRRDGRWGSNRHVTDLGIPEAARDVILRRVERLSPAAIEGLTLAAVIGRDFDLEVLASISDLGELPLLAALEEATAARLVDETEVDRWRFAHALVRSALYDTLSASRRVRLHRRVGETLEEKRPDDVTALAYHFTNAGPDQLASAIDYTTRAGDQAFARLAHDQAVQSYQSALALLDGRPGANAEQRCELLCRFGEAQKAAGDSAHRETLIDVAHLAMRLGDTDRLVRATLANNRGWASVVGEVDAERVAVLEEALEALDDRDSAARARLLATLAAELVYQGDRERRVLRSDEALTMARRVRDPDTLAHVLNVRHHTIWAPETLRERVDNSAEHLQVAAQLPDPLARWYASATRLQICMETGDIEEVDRHLAILADLTKQLGQAHLRFAEAVDRTWRALLTGRLDVAEAIATEAYQIGRSGGQADALIFYAGHLFALRWEQGRLGELVPLLEEVVANNPAIPAFASMLALCCCEADRLDDARAILEAGLAAGFGDLFRDMAWTSGIAFHAEVCTRLGHRAAAAVLFDKLRPYEDHVVFNGIFAFGSVQRSLGCLASTLDRTAEADAFFARAEQVHEKLDAPALLARTHADWAESILSRQDGDSTRARQLLERALSAARELGLAGVERRVKRLQLR